MSHSRSRFLRRTVALIVATVVLAAACGTGGGGKRNSPPNHLTVWLPGNSAAEISMVTKTLVPQFEKQTGAAVAVTYVDWPNISPKLNAAFAANSAPDVFGHGSAAAASFVAADRVVPLDARLASLPAADQADLKDSLANGEVNGKPYMMPLSMSGTLIVYRRDFLAAAGIDPATLTTWDSVRTAARKLTVRSGNKITRAGLLLGSADIANEQSFATLAACAGGSLISPDGKTPIWNNASGIQALTFFRSLYADQAVSNGLGDDFNARPPAQQPLALGTAAMATMQSSQVLQMLGAKPKLTDKIEVLPPPRFTAAKSFGGSTSGLFINKDSGNQALAWKFLTFMSSPTTSLAYAKAVGNLPIRRSGATSDYISASPQLTVYAKSQSAFVANPNVPGWVAARDVLDKYLAQALAGKMSPKAALDAAAKEATAALRSGS
jgi:multiple sugar transport system substrate-binding protein